MKSKLATMGVVLAAACWAVLGAAGCSDDKKKGAPDGGTLDTPELLVEYDGLVLTDLALEAVALVPDWLADDLAINLAKLAEDDQDELAMLLVGEDEPNLLDEIGFSVAHTSPEVLAMGTFYPELLVENAEMIYEYDAVLDYVELIDEGEPGVDPGWYTTARYQVETSPGVVEERTIDRELYYWNIVHPRLEDELPYYVDGWSSGNPVAPEDGYFWREFLWDRAADECPEDRTCPLLADTMAGTEVLVRAGDESDYDVDGIGQVWAFVDAAITWGAGEERPIQPNRIYAVGCGNCGEYADMHSSSARTALIPAQNSGARSNDHTWTEWWNDQWWGELGFYKNGIQRDRRDNDCDGTADDGLDETDGDEDGWTVAEGDCDDTDDQRYPGAAEVQNGYDDDCDGVADPDFVDAELDGDGDGYSIADGDCHDANPDAHPGADEIADNGHDDDCDGTADDGLDTADADTDGYTIAAGDCDDNDDGRHPGAEELGNGRDDNCDGVADEGLEGSDRDLDGFTMADGDCNDLLGGTNPDAQDPYLSSNRLYVITTARGDSYVSTDRTVDYVTLPSYLEFDIIDQDGAPVEGALITIFGTWEVYGAPNSWTWAGELITDRAGHAETVVGEYNRYGYAVHSKIGNAQPGDSMAGITPVLDPYETAELEIDLPGAVPAHPDATVADLTAGASVQASVDLAISVEGHRLMGDGAFVGSYSLAGEGGPIDVLVLDEAQYQAFEEGAAFQAQDAQWDVEQGELTVDLPLDRSWTLVLSNRHALAATAVGTVDVTASPAGAATWDGGPVSLAHRFRIPPGEHLAIQLVP